MQHSPSVEALKCSLPLRSLPVDSPSSIEPGQWPLGQLFPSILANWFRDCTGLEGPDERDDAALNPAGQEIMAGFQRMHIPGRF